MSAKGCRLSYSAGDHASPIRPLEVLSKSVVVRRPPWMFRLKTDKNNLESSFRKFERYFGGHNVGFTALLTLIIFNSLRFPVFLQITIRSDFFPCNLYICTLHHAVLHIPVYSKIAFSVAVKFSKNREKSSRSILVFISISLIVLYYFFFAKKAENSWFYFCKKKKVCFYRFDCFFYLYNINPLITHSSIELYLYILRKYKHRNIEREKRFIVRRWVNKEKNLSIK